MKFHFRTKRFIVFYEKHRDRSITRLSVRWYPFNDHRFIGFLAIPGGPKIVKFLK